MQSIEPSRHLDWGQYIACVTIQVLRLAHLYAPIKSSIQMKQYTISFMFRLPCTKSALSVPTMFQFKVCNGV